MSQLRHAMLLAAGLGTRLRPYTDTMPKCMLPIAGRPILEHNVRSLVSQGVTEIVINLHYLPDVITRYFGDGSEFGARIHYSYEAQPLGTAGALKQAAHLLDQAPFVVWYADNFGVIDLARVWSAHIASACIGTMAVFHREDVSQSGIVALDSRGRIDRFQEKPSSEAVFSHWVNAGILIMEPEILQHIPVGTSDLSKNVIPELLRKGLLLNAYILGNRERLWWIDTEDDLARTTSSFTEHL